MTSVEDIIAINMAAVDSHFHAEDTNSVESALSAFTDDCVWEVPNYQNTILYCDWVATTNLERKISR